MFLERFPKCATILFSQFSPTIYVLSLLSCVILMGIKRYLISLVCISLVVTVNFFSCFQPSRLLVCELFLILIGCILMNIRNNNFANLNISSMANCFTIFFKIYHLLIDFAFCIFALYL